MIYEAVARREIRYLGGDGQFGVQISVAGFPITKEMESHCDSIVYDLMEKFNRDQIANSPQVIKDKAETLERLQGCFPDQSKIYVEEIPSEYGNSGHEASWLIVTTNIGRIKIGWRKRVIVLDWKDTRNPLSAEALFPHEDVTKFDQLIHAWGYEKAAEYIKKILETP